MAKKILLYYPSRRYVALLCGILVVVTVAFGALYHTSGSSSTYTGTILPPSSNGIIRIAMAGDLILGRGIDQILPAHTNSTTPAVCTPRAKVVYDCFDDTRKYVEAAVNKSGPLPEHRGYEYPWGISLEDMDSKEPDVRIFNLETAVSDRGPPFEPNFKVFHITMHPKNVPTLKASKPSAYALANNHVMDFSVEGLEVTLDTLKSNNIPAAGAGLDIEQAQAPVIVETAHGRVLIFAMASYSAGVPFNWAATNKRPGLAVAPINIDTADEFIQLLQKYRQPGDVVVLSVHWGGNYQREPPGNHVEFARYLIDKGAVDVILGHSTHHLLGGEVYKNKLIIYGAGDLIDDMEGRCIPQRDRTTGEKNGCVGAIVRTDLGAIWYADVNSKDGTLHQLRATPTRVKKLSVSKPTKEDIEFAYEVVNGNFTALCNSTGTMCHMQLTEDNEFVLNF